MNRQVLAWTNGFFMYLKTSGKGELLENEIYTLIVKDIDFLRQ